MNRNQLKAATDAFLDELIKAEYSHSTNNGYRIYSIKVSGRDVGGGNQDNIDKRVATLRTAIGKVFRKHLRAAIETAADGSTPVSQKEGV